ncbi:MAG: serine/threonine-protein kinase, partial [Planctomycetota bacterium]
MEETDAENAKNGEEPAPTPPPPEDGDGGSTTDEESEDGKDRATGAPGVTVMTHTTSLIEKPPAGETRLETEILSGTRPPPTRPQTAHAGPDLASEKTLGPYRILSELGRGGMGVVYKAYDDKLKRTVALKVLIAGEDASEEAIARFQREAESVARLGHHPNIVPIYEIGQEGRLHYFAMLYVDGKPLDRMIFDGEVAPKRAAVITKRVAEALSHAHDHGVLHRDVKPANILVSTDGEPHLTDFGLAKNVASDTRVTQSGVTLGTPQYMPPEQAEGRLSEVDARSDVY